MQDARSLGEEWELSPSSAGQVSVIRGLHSPPFLYRFHAGTAPPAWQRHLLWPMGVSGQASVCRCWLVGDERCDPRLPCRRMECRKFSDIPACLLQCLIVTNQCHSWKLTKVSSQNPVTHPRNSGIGTYFFFYMIPAF